MILFTPRLRNTGVLFLLLVTASSCSSKLHLTYDYGRAYTAAFTAQADLTRPEVANSQYSLYGVEAAEIRLRVREEATDSEEGRTDEAF